MSRYDVIKAVHVLAAAIWAGGAVVAQAHDLRIRLGDPQAVAKALRDNDAIGYRIFLPASLVAFLAGVALVLDGPYGLEPWVIAGLAVFAVSFLAGVLYHGPEGKRLIAAAEAGEDVSAPMRRYLRVAGVESVLLLAVVVLMVLKP